MRVVGLADALSAGDETGVPGSFGFFKVCCAISVWTHNSAVQVTVDLTEQGIARYEEVVESVFQYLAMLRLEPWQQWIFDGVDTVSL